MKIKGMQQTIKQLQDALTPRSSRSSPPGVAEIKEHGAILREKIKQEGDAQEREITRAQKQHDTETYALTAQNVAEINALARILTSNSDQAHDLRKMLATFDHERDDGQAAGESRRDRTHRRIKRGTNARSPSRKRSPSPASRSSRTRTSTPSLTASFPPSPEDTRPAALTDARGAKVEAAGS
jgi:hypothetical protein